MYWTCIINKYFFEGNLFQERKEPEEYAPYSTSLYYSLLPQQCGRDCIHHYFMQRKSGKSWPGFDFM